MDAVKVIVAYNSYSKIIYSKVQYLAIIGQLQQQRCSIMKSGGPDSSPSQK